MGCSCASYQLENLEENEGHHQNVKDVNDGNRKKSNPEKLFYEDTWNPKSDIDSDRITVYDVRFWKASVDAES